MILNQSIQPVLDSPVRKIIAEVELYQGSTLVKTFKHDDVLVNFSIERVVEENKFFGVGICQHIKVTILDREREVDFVDTSYSLRVNIGTNEAMINPFPTNFYVTQTRRDENTNALSIYGYDAIKKASSLKALDIDYSSPQTVREVTEKCAAALGVTLKLTNLDNSECFNTLLDKGFNLDGSETLREVLNDIAEATQTIYYINNYNELVFRRLEKGDFAHFTIDKSKYFTLETQPNKRLSRICHTTELGDNLYAEISESGTTQFVRDNSIWTMVSNLDTLLQNAINEYGGFSIGQFDCYWRGNFLVEIGDKIGLVTKDNNVIYSYLLDDVIDYDGTLSQRTKWSYNDDTNEEGGGNPATLGEIIQQTYAKVDKAAGQIELVAKKTDELNDKVSALQINSESINLSVQHMEKSTNAELEGINSDIEELTKRVQAVMTPEEFEILIQSTLANGVTSVETTTGFKFNDEGLNITKTGSEMSTQITEDGMKVYRGGEEVLIANNVGVTARNLHAETYLIIGLNSRFEDYGDRTGCYYIGQGR